MRKCKIARLFKIRCGRKALGVAKMTLIRCNALEEVVAKHEEEWGKFGEIFGVTSFGSNGGVFLFWNLK